MKENLVKKPKKDENDFDDYEDEDIELEDDVPSKKSSSGDMDESKKRLFVVMGCIVGGTVLLLIILYIVSALSGPKNYSYDDIEKELERAAKAYFNDYPTNLPKEDGDIVEIDYSNLVAAGKINDISNYLQEGVSCSASVQVAKSGTEYLYTPILNCGDAYQTIGFSEKVKTDNGTTESGDGLYINGNYYQFRGENVNNYVQLDNALWRVVKISAEGNAVLILANGMTYSQPWDNRYNEERMYEAGINTYSVSRIKDFLDKIYSNPDEKNDENILSNSDKAKLVSYNMCVGKKSSSSSNKTNREECKKQEDNVKIGLLTISDYMYASLDTKCNTPASKSCMNYNYLDINDEWWTATASSEDDSLVYKIDRSGIPRTETCATYSMVRPVIYLNNNVLFKGGKGTLSEPYTVR